MSPSKKERLASLQEVSELHPLLNKLLRKLPNVTDVEHTHGSKEMGADFVVAKRHDTFGNIDFVGVIAKAGKIVQDFTDIERQIRECSIPRLYFGGKEKIILTEIWIIVTEHITKNAQEKIHHEFSGRKIIFIDGSRLHKLIDDHLSTFWTDVPLETGEYLTRLKKETEILDKALSVVQIDDKRFYVEQDLYKHQEDKYGTKQSNFNKPIKVDIFNEIENKDILLIEGGMGAGKSKLVRHIIDHYTTPEVYHAKQIVPIFCTYKDFIDKYNNDIEALISANIPEHLRLELDNVKYLLLIDGIDEKNMPADEQLEALAQVVSSAKKRKDTTILLTSRYFAGLNRTKELYDTISRYDIFPLSFRRTVEFLQALCKKLSITGRILEDLKKSPLFKQMPKSPIAAILLAKLINENTKDLPSNMTELYEKYSELSLGRWDISKGLQSQKEYQALDNIMMQIARLMLDNEINTIGIEEVKGIFASYLHERNLEIDPNGLFERLAKRCDLIIIQSNGTISFRHRTFMEYFYAKSLARAGELVIDNRAFQLYWMNTYFFCLGILKDCPKYIEELINLAPNSELEKWMKIINLGNYFLASYTSPYSAISRGLTSIMIEAAQLYKDIVNGNIKSTFQQMPQMILLYFLQLGIRKGYSYEFFRKGLEETALYIDEGMIPDEIKAYALFFANVAFIDIGTDESFDFILENYKKALPMDIALAIRHESKDMKDRTALMRKQDRHFRSVIKGNIGLSRRIEELYSTPILKLRDVKAKLKDSDN